MEEEHRQGIIDPRQKKASSTLKELIRDQKEKKWKGQQYKGPKPKKKASGCKELVANKNNAPSRRVLQLS